MPLLIAPCRRPLQVEKEPDEDDVLDALHHETGNPMRAAMSPTPPKEATSSAAAAVIAAPEVNASVTSVGLAPTDGAQLHKGVSASAADTGPDAIASATNPPASSLHIMAVTPADVSPLSKPSNKRYEKEWQNTISLGFAVVDVSAAELRVSFYGAQTDKRGGGKKDKASEHGLKTKAILIYQLIRRRNNNQMV